MPKSKTISASNICQSENTVLKSTIFWKILRPKSQIRKRNTLLSRLDHYTMILTFSNQALGCCYSLRMIRYFDFSTPIFYIFDLTSLFAPENLKRKLKVLGINLPLIIPGIN